VDVAKERICAMVSDFYGNVLVEPKEFPVTSTGMDALEQMISSAKQEHGLELMVIGLEQTGRLHEPIKRRLRRRWDVQIVHPVVTKHLRQGFSRNVKTDGMDLDALFRAVVGCYGSTVKELPVAYERWRIMHRARQQLVDDRAALKVRAGERVHAVLPGFQSNYDNIWTNKSAILILNRFESPQAVAKLGESGLREWLLSEGARCTQAKAEKLIAWAADAVSPGPGAATEADVLRDDLKQLAFLTGRIESYDRQMLVLLVESPFVLLLSVSGISHVLACGLGAEAGPMSLYPTARNLSGRAGLYDRRHQSDQTDPQLHSMAAGEPHLRHVLTTAGRCLSMPGGAFAAWAETRRSLKWSEKRIAAVMGNRFCRIAHSLLLTGKTFCHPQAKPGVSILGKLLNVAADLGLPAAQVTELAIEAAASIPVQARPCEMEELRSGAWKASNRPTEYGSLAPTTRQIARHTVPALLSWLAKPENNHDVAPTARS
jgi:transposase